MKVLEEKQIGYDKLFSEFLFPTNMSHQTKTLAFWTLPADVFLVFQLKQGSTNTCTTSALKPKNAPNESETNHA